MIRYLLILLLAVPTVASGLGVQNVGVLGGRVAGDTGLKFTADETHNFDTAPLQSYTAGETIDDYTVDEVVGSAVLEVSTDGGLNSSPRGLEFTLVNQDDVWVYGNTSSTYTEEVAFKFHLKLATGMTASGLGAFRVFAPCQDSIFGCYEELNIVYDGTSEWAISEDYGDNEAALTLGVDHEIIVRFVRDAAAGGYEVWVDGIKEISALNYNTTNRPFVQYHYFGSPNQNVNFNGTMYIDEIEIGSVSE